MYLDIKERGIQTSEIQGIFETGPVSDVRKGYAQTSQIITSLRPQHPVLCFSAHVLSAQADRFLQTFPGEVTYAVKANDNEEVLRTLISCGIDTFDVASLEEMAMVRSQHPAAGLHYHNPVKSRFEIETAYNTYGVRHFAFDDEAEYEKLHQICSPTDTTLVVRFRLDGSSAVHDFSSKFGATPDEAARLLKRAFKAGFACALTFHPGSQCYDPAAYARHIAAAAEIARNAGVPLSGLNVGGGFPAAYAQNDLPALEVYFENIAAAARKHFGETVPPLTCEPGRAMVASCMSMLVAVKHVRRGSGEVFLQDGIYGTLMEFSQTTLRPAIHLHRGSRAPASQDLALFQVYGPTCDPLDRLPGDYELPADIAEGDYLEFATMGAYSTATSTRFNGYGDVQIIAVEEPFRL